jgi:hypothetical protein
MTDPLKRRNAEYAVQIHRTASSRALQWPSLWGINGKKLPKLLITIPGGLVLSRWSMSCTSSGEFEGTVGREKRSICVGDVEGN